jgi:hypothetical protein
VHAGALHTGVVDPTQGWLFAVFVPLVPQVVASHGP